MEHLSGTLGAALAVLLDDGTKVSPLSLTEVRTVAESEQTRLSFNSPTPVWLWSGKVRGLDGSDTEFAAEVEVVRWLAGALVGEWELVELRWSAVTRVGGFA